MLVTIMTDASVCGETNAAGYGYWIASDRGCKAGGGAFNDLVKDSYEGEFKAVANALHQAITLGYVQYEDTVLIQLDNAGVVNTINGKNSNPPRDKTIASVISLIKGYVDKYKLKIHTRHVKGHSKHTQARYRANACCDETAKHHMRTKRGEIRATN